MDILSHIKLSIQDNNIQSKFIADMLRTEELRKSHIERLKNKIESGAIDFDNLVEKIDSKYKSDKYCLKYRNKHKEEECELLWLLFDYAEIYGEEYYNPDSYFPTQSFKIHDWLFSVVSGQGCYVCCEKLSG